MLGLRFTTEAQPRAKKGQPPQSTTGVASASSSQRPARPASGPRWSPAIGAMASASSGIVRARLTQKRRAMSTSSGLGPSSRLAVRGSRAMPQIGQIPGPLRRICGCIGQV